MTAKADTNPLREALEQARLDFENMPYQRSVGSMYAHRDASVARIDAALASEPVAGTGGASVEAVRQTIADEWGSHVCYYDAAGLERTCDTDTHCRCADIARAVISQYGPSLSPQPRGTTP